MPIRTLCVYERAIRHVSSTRHINVSMGYLSFMGGKGEARPLEVVVTLAAFECLLMARPGQLLAENGSNLKKEYQNI